jgi:peptidoglycan/LPS O-acetylase OafA/YrhL
MAMISTYFIEKPLARRLRRRLEDHRSGSSVASAASRSEPNTL